LLKKKKKMERIMKVEPKSNPRETKQSVVIQTLTLVERSGRTSEKAQVRPFVVVRQT